MARLTTADEIAMYGGGGLVLLGVVGIGLLEMLVGAPHPVSGEGQIVHEALVPIALRSYVVLAGLLVWGATALYKLLSPAGRTGRAGEPREAAAE